MEPEDKTILSAGSRKILFSEHVNKCPIVYKSRSFITISSAKWRKMKPDDKNIQRAGSQYEPGPQARQEVPHSVRKSFIFQH